MNINSTVTLLSGAKMPVLGFGLYQLSNPSESIPAALRAGYRHLDSARLYRNEEHSGQCVHEWRKQSGSQDSVWLTTKITGHVHGTDKANKAVDECIAKIEPFGLKWDLFLLHDPTAGKQKRLEAYRVLMDRQAKGLIRCIGVSNYGVHHLKELKQELGVHPDVNQIELHPWLQQQDIVDYCKQNGIVVEAYCPLARAERMNDETVQSVAKEVRPRAFTLFVENAEGQQTGKTPAQVLIRWSLQKNLVPLPKSDTPSRIVENSQVFDFELTSDQMSRLDALGHSSAKGAVSWNPVAVP